MVSVIVTRFPVIDLNGANSNTFLLDSMRSDDFQIFEFF